MVYDYKEYARQMRENAVIDEHNRILCSPELWEQIASIIENIPTADVEEVKHGEWIAHYNGSFRPIYRCSVCNERLIGYSDPNKVPYCHCGAKMDGGKHEDSN